MAERIQRDGYEEIVCGAGETFNKSISDGETWSNKLLNIEASGAGYYIDARANNFAIRNFGIKGKLDRQASPDNQIFVTRVSSAGATGVIENFYHPGTAYSRSYSKRPSGIYVFPGHAGDLEIRNWYVKDLPSHAVYGSAPGNPSNHGWKAGSGGSVRILDSYCADLENSGWRIGTNGSYVENSVAFRTARGVWAYYESPEIRNCDLGGNGVDIKAGNSSWGNTGTVTVTNTRYETTDLSGGGQIIGSPAGYPQERIPEGCPTTPVEAASGSGAPGSGDDTGDDTDDRDSDDGDNGNGGNGGGDAGRSPVLTGVLAVGAGYGLMSIIDDE